VVVLSVVQGTLGPIISTASDIFQARKLLLVGCCAVSFVGACIAPGSSSIYRLIVANILIGVGFASVPLAYAVPSEILPRRWRPCKLKLFYMFFAMENLTIDIFSGASRGQHCRSFCYCFWPFGGWCSDET
jgi:MFS family permease